MKQLYERVERLTRRQFFKIPVDMLVALCGLAAASAGLLRMPMPNVLPSPSRRFRIGKLKDFPANSERYFESERLLVRADDHGIYATSLVCTHLGCTVAKNADGPGFVCPCHGSRYRHDGSVIAGPAPRRLRTYQIVADPSGWLVVDGAREVPPDARLKV